MSEDWKEQIKDICRDFSKYEKDRPYDLMLDLVCLNLAKNGSISEIEDVFNEITENIEKEEELSKEFNNSSFDRKKYGFIAFSTYCQMLGQIRDFNPYPENIKFSKEDKIVNDWLLGRENPELDKLSLEDEFKLCEFDLGR